MFILLVSILSWSVANQNICYLSLNNEKEFVLTRDFITAVNAKAGTSIEVEEFQQPSITMNPEESFRKMVASGKTCDGLVISGHHYGSFGGKLAQGQLGINFIEKLSCKAEFREWFQNVKSLWLQGCRTLGVGTRSITARDVDADFHTNRVGSVLTADHLEASFADLSIEFSATLDQDNPLSSRYLRVFPRATVFGWTKTAPGESAGSQYSILYHLAHIVALTNTKAPEAPRMSFSAEQAKEYAHALSGLFTPVKGTPIEEINLNAWINHGNVRDNTETPGFFNPDLEAYPALVSQENPILLRAKNVACTLEEASDVKEITTAIEEILSDVNLLALNFNNIWEKFRTLKKESFKDLEVVRQILQNNQKLASFISTKLASTSVGIIRKVDYYAFLKDVSGGNKEIEEQILVAAKKILVKDPLNYNEIDFQITLLQALAQNQLLGSSAGYAIISEVAKNKSEHLRAAVAAQAANFGEYALPTLESLKNDKTMRVRGAVGTAAYFVGAKANHIVDELKNDSSENVRWEMAERLQLHPDRSQALALLRHFMTDTSTMVREITVVVAKSFRDINLLRELTNDSDSFVSQRANDALSELAGNSGVKGLFN